MYTMFLYILLSRCANLLLLIVYFCSANGNENENDRRAFLDRLAEDINRQMELLDICKSANLDIIVYPDHAKKTVSVFFELSDSKFERCFKYFDIILEKKGRTVDVAKIMYRYDKQKKASHIFENVPCGMYEIVITPYYEGSRPALMEMRVPKLINMSSDDCRSNFHERVYNMLVEDIRRETIVLIAVVSVMSVIAVSGLVYFYYSKGFEKEILTGIEIQTEVSEDTDKSEVKDIHIYMLNYYNKRNTMQRVDTLRHFLEEISCYKSVNVIKDELPRILTIQNDWFNEALTEKWEDGSITKVIIISEPENEDEDHEVENYICTQAIKTLENNKCRSLCGYSTLFVVKFRDSEADCRAIEKFVGGARYTIPNHLSDLCIDLCCDSGLNSSDVKRKIDQVYANHEIRYLDRD